MQVRSHVACMVLQVDLETLVSKDLLLLAEDGIGECGVELGDGLGLAVGSRDQRDGDGLVGV